MNLQDSRAEPMVRWLQMVFCLAVAANTAYLMAAVSLAH